MQSLISSKLDIPVEIITVFPIDAKYECRSKSTMSAEDVLKHPWLMDRDNSENISD